MRLAGSPDVYDALARQYAGQGIPHDAANHLAAEAMTGGVRVETRADTFFRLYELLQSKGYSEPAAQHLAVEMMEGREPMARETKRFAGVYDEPGANADLRGWAD
jgi:pyrroline-5-carboxylate reductase